MTVKTRNEPRLFSLVLALGLSAAGTAGASDCKGMSQSQCEGDAACTWVEGYTTKKGVKVDSYCRNKSSRSTGADKGAKSETDDQSAKSSS